MSFAVAMLNYISSGILWQIFCQTGIFAGFSLYINYFPVRISKAAMGGARDIIFHNLGAQWKDTPSYCDFLRGFFFFLFAGRISEAAMGRTGVWGHNMIYKKRQKEFKQFKYKKRIIRRET